MQFEAATDQEVWQMVQSANLPQTLKSQFIAFFSATSNIAIARRVFGMLKSDAATADYIKETVEMLLHSQTPTAVGALDVVAALVNRFGPHFRRNSAALRAQLALRSGPIPAPADGQLRDIGIYFKLVKMEKFYDDVLTQLVTLDREAYFTPMKPEALLHLLRLVGAPGIGKSTALAYVWLGLRKRMEEIRDEAASEFRDLWGTVEGKRVLKRLQRSFSDDLHLTFVHDLQDSSSAGAPHDLGLAPAQQLSFRMLCSCLETDRTYDQWVPHMLAQLQGYQPLQPGDVVRFVVHCAGGSSAKDLLVVWAFDETNIAQPPAQGGPTWVQLMLSAAVATRVSLLHRCQTPGARYADTVLPVFLAATTRGTSAMLNLTASSPAGIETLALPLLLEPDIEHVAFNFLRRVGKPVPDEFAGRLRLVLSWVGHNPRLLESALVLVFGDNSVFQTASSYQARLGIPGGVDQALHALYRRMLKNDSLERFAKRKGLLAMAIGHALLMRPVMRGDPLPEGSDGHPWVDPSTRQQITWQDLESCGLIMLLRPQGQRRRTSGDADAPEELHVYIPALVVLGCWADLQIAGPNADERRSLPPLLFKLADDWQSREAMDCSHLVSNLYILRYVLGLTVVPLSDLLPTIAKGDALASVEVCVPEQDFIVHRQDKQLGKDGYAALVHGATAQAKWAWLGVGNEQAPDSGLVLLKPGGGKLSVVIQSKVRDGKKPVTLSPAQLQAEFAKRWQVDSADLLVLYVTDQEPAESVRQLPNVASVPFMQRHGLAGVPRVLLIAPADHRLHYGMAAVVKAALKKSAQAGMRHY